MARSPRIRGIKPKQSFRQNGERIVEARLEDFLSWRPAIDDPARAVELHDMRIAAKRLRYAIEIFALCFPDARETLKDLTDIQERLGTIHDLDVLAEMLRVRLGAMDAHVQQEAVEIVRAAESRSQRSNRLRALLNAGARDQQRLGLIGLLGEMGAERQAQFEEFRLLWDGARLDLLAETIRAAIVGVSRASEMHLTGDQVTVEGGAA